VSAAASAISIEVSVCADAWHAACPDAEALVAAAARAALAAAGVELGRPAIVAAILTDDAEQQRLNRTYRGTDAPTNVLAFPLGDAPVAAAGAPLLFGDVVLALETIGREALEQRKPLADHLRHLVVHGVLHLLGFDHLTDAETAIMEAREVEILAGLGVPDPYRDTI